MLIACIYLFSCLFYLFIIFQKPKERLCGKSEETGLETNKPYKCSYNATFDNEICVTDDESDDECSVIGESHNTQMLKLPKPDVAEHEESSDDADYKEEVTTSDDEEQDIRSVVSRGSESANSSRSSTVSVHVCPYENCNKFFSRPFRLNQHVRTHTGEVSITLSFSLISSHFGLFDVFIHQSS